MTTDIPSSDHRRDSFATTQSQSGEGDRHRVVRIGAPTTDVDASALYPDRSVLTLELSRAFELLQLVNEHLGEALDALSESLPIESDDHVLHARACLEELFVLRAIGNGFAMAINGCLGAFSNLSGLPLDQEQIVSLRTVVLAIYRRPFLTVESADELLDKLEESGLRIEPAGFGELSEVLADEGLS